MGGCLGTHMCFGLRGDRNTVGEMLCLIEDVVVALFTHAERMEVWDRRAAGELSRSMGRSLGRTGASIRAGGLDKHLDG
jgi:hypothetical protein